MQRLIFILPLMMLLSCAASVTRFEQYSLSMSLPVAADSSVTIGDDERLNGVLWLTPILKAEDVTIERIKLIQNYGFYYLCGEGFKHVWVIERKRDGLTGKYKALDVTPKDKTDVYEGVGFARYGEGEQVCVRFKFNKQEVYIDKKGRAHETCNR